MSGEVTKAKYDETLRHALGDYAENNMLSLKQLGAKVGKSEAYVSRYLNGKPEGDTEAFEQRVRDMLERAGKKRAWADIFFDTDAVKTCNLVFDLIREASDIGLVHGPAGIGKSKACARYSKAHPTVIFFTGEEGNGSSYGVMHSICKSIDMRRWEPRKQKRAEFLFEKLNGSERLIIIDNAQRLNMSGLRWLFDFHDETGVSVALVGNPEVLDKIAGNDQMSSRIGFKQDIGEMLGKGKWLDQAADKMVSEMWPKAAADIGILARETARKPGHLRTLNKQMRIAIRLCETDEYKGKFGRAFVEARHLIGADNSDE